MWTGRLLNGCALAAALMFTLSGPAQLHGADTTRHPKAIQLAQSMMQAMGGQQAWNSAHFVRFDFRVKAGDKTVMDRSHLWDKQTGRYRLEETTKEGKSEVVLFNVNDRQGAAYINGKKVEDAAARKAVEDAYAAFINDMYWLSMPWKWLDPGVNLKYLGEKKRGGKTFEVVELTFDHVGLTPGDMYYAFLSPQSHLMEHWEYVLQSHNKVSWDWQYTETHGVKLASNHVSDDHKTSINMGDVRVLETADEGFFTDPACLLSNLK